MFSAHKPIISINSLLLHFKNNPTDFEYFIADIYRARGYTVQVTPPSNDGGIDILMEKEDVTFFHDLAIAAERAMRLDAVKAMRIFAGL